MEVSRNDSNEFRVDFLTGFLNFSSDLGRIFIKINGLAPKLSEIIGISREFDSKAYEMYTEFEVWGIKFFVITKINENSALTFTIKPHNLGDNSFQLCYSQVYSDEVVVFSTDDESKNGINTTIFEVKNNFATKDFEVYSTAFEDDVYEIGFNFDNLGNLKNEFDGFFARKTTTPQLILSFFSAKYYRYSKTLIDLLNIVKNNELNTLNRSIFDNRTRIGFISVLSFLSKLEAGNPILCQEFEKVFGKVCESSGQIEFQNSCDYLEKLVIWALINPIQNLSEIQNKIALIKSETSVLEESDIYPSRYNQLLKGILYAHLSNFDQAKTILENNFSVETPIEHSLFIILAAMTLAYIPNNS